MRTLDMDNAMNHGRDIINRTRGNIAPHNERAAHNLLVKQARGEVVTTAKPMTFNDPYNSRGRNL